MNIIYMEFVGVALQLGLSVSRNGDVLSDEVLKILEFGSRFEEKLSYESRINGFIKSEKGLETYSSISWKHVVCFDERWSDEYSFMEQMPFKTPVRFSTSSITIAFVAYMNQGLG
ncbi:hypothetical protein Tco_0226878 [Tanacetum coccineum]